MGLGANLSEPWPFDIIYAMCRTVTTSKQGN